MILHPLTTTIEPPLSLNNPFDYVPHPLCLLAVEEMKTYLYNKVEWRQEIERGKMFGVLIVEKPPISPLSSISPSQSVSPSPPTPRPAELFYLMAYSGQIGGRSDWDDFVPAVYDYLQPDGYFKQHEAEIDQLNRDVDAAEAALTSSGLLEQLSLRHQEADAEIGQYKQLMMASKMLRDLRRKERHLSPQEKATLVRESQFQKAELHRKKQHFYDEIGKIERKIAELERPIMEKRQLRKEKSDALQQWLFRQFRLLNAVGEEQDLLEIFRHTAMRVPPAGAGECCEPKLLQYAFAHHLRPLAIAMFWWGDSPRQEVRHHLQFYPACSGKCKPILSWMLDLKSLLCSNGGGRIRPEQPPLDTVYEDDEILVVCKPTDVLTIPGIDAPFSIYSAFREAYPDLKTPVIVHRLDMATSGLLVLAKTKAAHLHLQQQFASRTVKKRYVAVLDGVPHAPRQGRITLPLSPDLLDRPRQIVDYEHGKPAVTDYIINKVEDGKTWITLFPLTGRTHQLRVHCAHQDGLGVPIVGDEIYGQRAERLLLHAEYLEFEHPSTSERMKFERVAAFWK